MKWYTVDSAGLVLVTVVVVVVSGLGLVLSIDSKLIQFLDQSVEFAIVLALGLPFLHVCTCRNVCLAPPAGYSG